MASLTFTIPGKPQPQGRPRAARWQAKDGRSGVTLRDPSKSRGWKERAVACVLSAMEGRGLEAPVFPAGTPVELDVVAYFACPKSEERKRNPQPRRPHVKRGDLDNVVKAVKDALNGLVWADDSQVYRIQAYKWIAGQGDSARVSVMVCGQGGEDG